jgi:nitronate monooxygenase
MVHHSLFDTRFPLIQAPMAGVQDVRLALAACTAGALGSLPAAMLDNITLDAALTQLDASGLPYNVNFFCHTPPASDANVEARWRERLAPYYQELGLDSDSASATGGRRPFGEETAAIVERHRPAVISFHFGLPAAALLARAKATGARILSSATTVAEAHWLQQHGADAIIAQGLEAGGHRGHFLSTDVTLQSGTLPLLRAIRDAVDMPVIAAGGIADAASVSAAMDAGACAVQTGTAFLLCPEATTGPLHRQRLKDLNAPTQLTNLFSGGLARGLVNRLMRDLGPVSELAPPFPLASPALAPLRSRAEALGRDDFSPLWSGTHRGGCREVPAAEIVRELAVGFGV